MLVAECTVDPALSNWETQLFTENVFWLATDCMTPTSVPNSVIKAWASDAMLDGQPMAVSCV